MGHNSTISTLAVEIILVGLVKARIERIQSFLPFLVKPLIERIQVIAIGLIKARIEGI